jgi:MFS transporter, SP family, sugar:H+ symporter
MSPFQYGVDFGLIGGIQGKSTLYSQPNPPKFSPASVLTSIPAMIGFMQIFGYRDPATAVGWNISAERQQLISSLMTLGAVIASGLAGPLARKLGRKSCLWIACILCAASDAIMMGTTSIGALYVGRLFIGLANGLFMTFSQLYIQECSPAEYRGLLLSAFQFWTSIGTLVGTIVDNFTAPLEGKKEYLIPLGLIYIVPFFIFLGLFLIPESPRWLMEKGKVDKARKSLLWLRPNQDAVDGELNTIQAAIDEARANSGKALFFEMFSNPVDRRRTILAVCAVNTQAASGAMFMIAYGTYFFEMAGVGQPFTNSVALVTVGVVAIIINTCVITRWGRRRVFLIVGLILCAITMLIIAAVYTAQPKKESTMKLIVGISVIYILGYNGMVCLPLEEPRKDAVVHGS